MILYKCDNCGKEALATPIRAFNRILWTHPEGWAEKNIKGRIFTACSKDCRGKLDVRDAMKQLNVK